MILSENARTTYAHKLMGNYLSLLHVVKQ